jgi:hypothetical protein
MRNGIKAVRGTSYTVKSSDDLYPTSGASDDYAYSRHFVDTNKGKIISYTVEWGTEFQPPYIEMQNIIDEITAGLVAFCLWICKNIPQHESIIIESSSRISSIVIQDQNEDLQNQPDGEFIINDTSNIIIK